MPLPLRSFPLLRLAAPLAISLAALGGLRAQDDLHTKINNALTAARPALMSHLKAASAPAARVGELALLTLAAEHDGVEADDPVMKRAIARLAKADASETYDLALRLMVCEVLPDCAELQKVVKHDVKELLTHRDDRGGFGYSINPGGWDLSNTQYAALGLRSAAALGTKVEHAVWARIADEVKEQQDSYGGFGYTKHNSGFDSYASMTAAGIAVMAICRQQLGDHSRLVASLDKGITRGWQWFNKNDAVIGSPRERWSLYFHYGLERAAILTDVDKVGNVDWYAKGAEMLVDMQMSGGGWQSESDGYPGTHLGEGRGNSVPTAFAVLFLCRKFKKVLGPITQHVVLLVNIGPYSKDADVDACAEQLTSRGKEAMPDLLFALRSEVEPQRRAASQALKVIAGEVFGYDPKVDADKNREALRSAELWYLKNR